MNKLEILILRSVENWKKTCCLPSGKKWKPESYSKKGDEPADMGISTANIATRHHARERREPVHEVDDND